MGNVRSATKGAARVREQIHNRERARPTLDGHGASWTARSRLNSTERAKRPPCVAYEPNNTQRAPPAQENKFSTERIRDPLWMADGPVDYSSEGFSQTRRSACKETNSNRTRKRPTLGGRGASRTARTWLNYSAGAKNPLCMADGPTD